MAEIQYFLVVAEIQAVQVTHRLTGSARAIPSGTKGLKAPFFVLWPRADATPRRDA